MLRGAMSAEFVEFTGVLSQKQAEVIAISDDPEVLGLASIALELPVQTPEWISPLTCVVPGQLFALHLAATRGFNPDHPRALHKVTETI